MTFLQFAKERYSCRSLKDQPVEKESIDMIIKAGMMAPTACNYQPAKIFVLESADALAKAKQLCRQSFISPCPVIFVIGADESRGWVRDYDGKNFAEVDASIIATHMMLEIHDLGLATTWIGHFDPAAFQETFPAMQGYSLIALFAVGYPADDAVPSPLHSRTRSEAELAVRY